MADLRTNNQISIIQADQTLRRRHIELQVKEKYSLIKKLQMQIEDIKNIEIDRIGLQIRGVEKEIEKLQAEIPIDVN
ncbi:MAG: hypothetical protein GY817_01195 [bacterium]|nr:hypothetical protein [bacterium]